MREVLRLCDRLEHVKVLCDFNRTCPPTHVLTRCGEDRYARRTLKYLSGIAMGIWILDINWLRDCAKSRKWIEETPYEILGDLTGLENGPRESRIARKERKPKLFEGFSFDLEGEWEDYERRMKRSDVRRLLKLCGAKEKTEDGRKRLRVFCEPSKLTLGSSSSSSEEEEQELVVHLDWILNCISTNRVLPVDEICGMLRVND